MNNNKNWKNNFGNAIAIVSFLFAIFAWYSQYNSKSITVIFASATKLRPPLVSSLPELKLMINGEIIDNPIFHVVRVLNSGNVPIVASDFERPFELRLNGKMKLIRITEVKNIPQDVSPKVDWDSNTIVIKPLLLNPGDQIELSFLTSGDSTRIVPSTRIIGISTINEENENFYKEQSSLPRNIFLFVIGLVGVMIAAGNYAKLLYLRERSFILTFVSFLYAGVTGPRLIGSVVGYTNYGFMYLPSWKYIVMCMLVAFVTYKYSRRVLRR